MPDRRKSYVGFIEHDELSFRPQQFTNFLTGYLGWQILQPLKVDFPAGHEEAIIKLTRAYGQGSVELMMTASDSGTYTPRGGKPVQRVALCVIFDDPADWHDPASENLVARTMRELDEAIWKLTTYERIWQRTTGYWRCGTALYQAPDASTSEPAVVPPPPSPPPIQSSGAFAADPALAITAHNAVEGGALGMKWQSTFRVVNGMGHDFCVKLVILDQNEIPVRARDGSPCADHRRNLCMFAQLERPPYPDATYTVNFFLPYDAFAPVPQETRLYRGRAYILKGQLSQAELSVLAQSASVEFSKTDP